MDLETERRLIRDIRTGNKDAFRTLVDPLISKYYRSALAILGSAQLAEEAVQNALIDSYSAIISGKEILNFQGWFNRVIANRSLDIARKEQTHKHNLHIDELEIQDSSSSPLEDVLKKEQSQRLIQAVMELDVQYRVVVGLYYFQELKIEEIAALLDVKEGTVKSRLYHARLKLSQTLYSTFPQAKEMMTI